LYSRNQKLLNSKYPELLNVFSRQKAESFILDGEIVAFENGVTSFAKLQQRMQIQHSSAELRRLVPVWYYAFDLPYFGTFDLRQIPLRDRKTVLEGAFPFSKPAVPDGVPPGGK
jgi:ATP-dependent DNA ligase